MANPKLILAGIMGRFPVGGVTWCTLQYIAGFQSLGYDVFYLEDTGECGFDPVTNSFTKDPSYAINYIRQHLKIVGLQNSWLYVDHIGHAHGKTFAQVAELCREADLMVNLSGGCWFPRPEYQSVRKVFIDTDPGFTQINLLENTSVYDFLSSHDIFFTFALNIGHPTCTIAPTPFHWNPTIQPLIPKFWPVVPAPPHAPFSTILSWRIDSFSGMGKGKGGEIFGMVDLPKKSPQRILLAIAGRPPTALLSRHGWELTDAVAATIDPYAYQTFIQASKAELGFAKAMYIETHSGWFSDRTQCYLASGRPGLVRDTGFSKIFPIGQGLLTFTNETEVLEGIEAINQAYPQHVRSAREFAEEYFSADKVLKKLLERARVS